jgi:rod shape-determining protein MreC
VAVISSLQNKSEPALFVKSRHGALGFAIAVAFALSLMFADYHYKTLAAVRGTLSVLVAPLQYAVDYPVQIVGWVQALARSKKALLDENMQIRYQQTMLEAKMQHVLALREENSQLKELLSTSAKASTHIMAAQILAVDTTNARQILVLNKGSRDGVYTGQPVLDAKGIMGQVVDVGLLTSTVLLISDSKCAVPVRNNRTGERAILMGTNNIGQLSLINLPKTSSIEPGDMLVTSGLGRHYPEGYPVGRVQSVQNLPGEAFVTVLVNPVALLNRSRLVLLIWPDKEQEVLTLQINERLNAVGGQA